MKCLICHSPVQTFSSAKILHHHEITYFKCPHCDFIQTEKPFWLEEAYIESINLTDTGILKRNTLLSKISSSILFCFFNHKGMFLDFAGGYGLLTRQMRDIGFDFFWKDKYSKNLLARGFEYQNGNIELITSFESFEHFTEPLSEIENMLHYSSNILFSTFLLPKTEPLPGEWWYYGLEHGQHISIYSYKTLEYIADKFQLNLYSNKKNIHLLTRKKLSNAIFSFLIILSRLGLNNIFRLFLQSKTESDAKLLSHVGSNR